MYKTIPAFIIVPLTELPLSFMELKEKFQVQNLYNHFE